MKIRAQFKDPDTMPDAVDDAVKKFVRDDPSLSGLNDDEREEITARRAEAAKEHIAEKWMEYSEYIAVEFDTEAGTATVIPRKRLGPMTPEDRLHEVREARRRGDLLGELIDRYGADAVVAALGVNYIACSLGMRDDIDGDDEDCEVMP